MPTGKWDWRILHRYFGLSFFWCRKLHVHVPKKEVKPKLFVPVVSILVILSMTSKDTRTGYDKLTPQNHLTHFVKHFITNLWKGKNELKIDNNQDQ